MLTEFCVYTIASRDKLDPAALEHAPFVNQESRVWSTAVGMLERGREMGQSLPILLADAKDCSAYSIGAFFRRFGRATAEPSTWSTICDSSPEGIRPKSWCFARPESRFPPGSSDPTRSAAPPHS